MHRQAERARRLQLLRAQVVSDAVRRQHDDVPRLHRLLVDVASGWQVRVRDILGVPAVKVRGLLAGFFRGCGSAGKGEEEGKSCAFSHPSWKGQSNSCCCGFEAKTQSPLRKILRGSRGRGRGAQQPPLRRAFVGLEVKRPAAKAAHLKPLSPTLRPFSFFASPVHMSVIMSFIASRA